MITINLALQKQAYTPAGTTSLTSGTSLGKLFGGIRGFKFESDMIGELPIKRAIGVLIVLISSYFASDFLRKQSLAALQVQYEQLDRDKRLIDAEVAKTRDYKNIESQLKKDEESLRAKIQAIKILLSGRRDSVEVLKELSESTPKNVWLTTFALEESKISLTGYSLGLSEVSEFLRKLNGSTHFQDFTLLSTEKENGRLGLEIAKFQLAGKKR